MSMDLCTRGGRILEDNEKKTKMVTTSFSLMANQLCPKVSKEQQEARGVPRRRQEPNKAS
jgi:hypothetical protein